MLGTIPIGGIQANIRDLQRSNGAFVKLQPHNAISQASLPAPLPPMVWQRWQGSSTKFQQKIIATILNTLLLLGKIEINLIHRF
jgi:hypothetical protein